jgi:hypothetical protein
MESEYISMFVTTQNVLWLNSLEQQFGLPTLVPRLWCDNQAAIAVATGGELTFKRSRFMNVKYHFVREKFEEKKLLIDYVKSGDNVADLFTKRLAHDLLSNLRYEFLESYSERDELEE